jgi:hypothetical protein
MNATCPSLLYVHVRQRDDVALYIVEEETYTERPSNSVMAEKVTISIPVDLKEKIDKFLEASKPEFEDVEAFILFLLSEFLSDEDEPEEDELLEKRLRALGYIE